jgi:hypothetical protein
MSPLPTTPQGFLAAGYAYDSSGICDGCGKVVTWYVTPAGKRIPIDTVTYAPHYASCKKSSYFQKEK